jgi:hypothetical protein
MNIFRDNFGYHLTWNYAWTYFENLERKDKQFWKRVFVFKHFPGEILTVGKKNFVLPTLV